MRNLLAAAIILTSLASVASAKEQPADLRDYTTRASDIFIGKVKADHGDGSVTVQVETVLKGDAAGLLVIRGETGFCLMQGPVSQFMHTGKRYLVFLFENQAVGRLGGILAIDGKMLSIQYMHGFTGTTFDQPTSTQKLPLEQAVSQIKAILEEEERS
jgi:hypothetical protein